MSDTTKAAETAEMTEATETGYTLTLSAPLEVNGRTYDELHFDFDSLRGRDMVAIEQELNAQNVMVLVAKLSTPFLLRCAARASREKIGIAGLNDLTLRDFNAVVTEAKNFL
ncbi:MAG: phage tail assembly protein [Oscillospiraceae bacterium]|nr:phage tail assembly protein [Oscillospiraceae bacterium]